MDTRLVIEEHAGQEMQITPVLPQIKHKIRHQHSAHSEIDIASGHQTTDTGIYDRHAGLSVLPGLYKGFVAGFYELRIGFVDGFKLIATLAFKLLNKMAMPMQTRHKPIQGSFVRAQF